MSAQSKIKSTTVQLLPLANKILYLFATSVFMKLLLALSDLGRYQRLLNKN